MSVGRAADSPFQRSARAFSVIEAVVFDLDGVLIDSEPVWEEVRRGLVQERHGRWLPEAQSHLMGMSTPEWARYLGADLGVDLPPERIARPFMIAGLLDLALIGVAVTALTRRVSGTLRARAATAMAEVPHPA